jgi:2-polyprenyl-3-methyl-5-hydroxy-6-metoxy-1,4-benzoquinol methylase
MKPNYLSELYKNIHSKKNYYHTAWRNEMRRSYFTHFLTESTGTHFLDLGSRDGFFDVDLLRNKKITAIDIDDIALDKYKTKYQELNPTILKQDLNYGIDLPDASQDIILAGELVEHVVYPHDFVEEVYRVLKPNGIFIGSTPNALRYDKRIQFVFGKDPKEYSDYTHLQYFSYKSLKKLLTSTFKKTEIFSYNAHRKNPPLFTLTADGFIWRCRK